MVTTLGETKPNAGGSRQKISGSTRLYAVIGHPVAQVMAPAMMNRVFAEVDADAVLVPIEVSPADLGSVVEGLKRAANLDGILVTVPHKLAVTAHVDSLSEAAGLAGSVNALRRESDGTWRGDNFDGHGFVRGLVHAGHPVADQCFTLVGAGGAGVSIAVAVLQAGASSLSIVDVDHARAEALAIRLAARWPGQVQSAAFPDRSCDVIINATPMGLRESDPLPFTMDGLRPGTVVADIIMKPAETRLLLEAARRGLRTHPGLPMLREQIPLYREFFSIH